MSDETQHDDNRAATIPEAGGHRFRRASLLSGVHWRSRGRCAGRAGDSCADERTARAGMGRLHLAES